MRVFQGTRDNQEQTVSFTQALLHPNAPYGGLYTLSEIPKFDPPTLERLMHLPYHELAQEIFQALKLNIPQPQLAQALASYESFDYPNNPAPIIQINHNLSLQKLYCGPTRAFKDMALQPFGSLFCSLKENAQYLILVATSGDTGPATLQSFANKKGIKVICLYPKDGTSQVQKLQMTTQEAKNLKVIGIDGDFDDAQSALKNLLQDQDFQTHLAQKNIALSAANSVNFGRIAFQILYHIKSCSIQKHPLHLIIPSGNFGNALGAFYAQKMGFPIKKIWIASNANNILSQFIQTGLYDISNKSLQKTLSPAMDILQSSNIERILFALFGPKRTKECMQSLQEHKKYSLHANELSCLQEHFGATSCDDAFCLQTIFDFSKQNIILDPHSACGIKAYQQIQKTHQEAHCILCSTAEWTKFPSTIAKACNLDAKDDQQALAQIAKTFQTPIPQSITQLFTKKQIHTQSISKEEIKPAIIQWLKNQ